MARETENKELDSRVTTSGVAALMKRPEAGFYVIAECQDEVAGCLMVTFEWSDWRNGCFWWIQSVYVKPGFRRRGIFRSLYKHVRDLARQRQDVCGLRLYVEQDNAIAQQTYRSLGMHTTPYRMYETEFE